ncbi:hypothetical protein RRSWK_04966 [Rhodopirellula sp. SWK7]|nr:hypothetical protein RRSWK_04966 [Rhodopirellula sp. SWK7]
MTQAGRAASQRVAEHRESMREKVAHAGLHLGRPRRTAIASRQVWGAGDVGYGDANRDRGTKTIR